MIESDIAAHFQVSRTVVRDVLGRLQERGLIRKSQTSRWIAGPLTAQLIRDRFELRKVLEPMALVAASANWDREPISQLRIRAEAARQKTGDTPLSGSDDLEAALLQCTVLKAANTQLVEFIQQNLLPLNAANKVLTHLGLPIDRVAIDDHRDRLLGARERRPRPGGARAAAVYVPARSEMISGGARGLGMRALRGPSAALTVSATGYASGIGSSDS